MSWYIPADNFTDKVMVQVRKMERRRQRQLLLAEKLLSALPVRTLFSVAAAAPSCAPGPLPCR